MFCHLAPIRIPAQDRCLQPRSASSADVSVILWTVHKYPRCALLLPSLLNFEGWPVGPKARQASKT
jgi:hypothetical protein